MKYNFCKTLYIEHNYNVNEFVKNINYLKRIGKGKNLVIKFKIFLKFHSLPLLHKAMGNMGNGLIGLYRSSAIYV